MPDDAPVMPPQRPMDALSRILMGIQDQQPPAIPQGPSAMTQAAQAMYGRPVAISSPPDDDVAPMPNAAASPVTPAPVDAARSTLGAIKAPNRALAIAPPNPSQTDAGRAAMAQYSAPPPNPADFKPKWWERLLGGVTAGAMAYGHNPNALEAGTDVTNRRFNTAEGKYQQAHNQAGDVLTEQDRQFKNSEQSWRDMLNSQNANERIQSLEEERQAKEQKLQNAVDPNSIVKEDDGTFTGTTYGGEKVPVTPKGFQKPTVEKDPTTYDQTVIQKFLAKYPNDRPRAYEEAAKEIRQTELDKSKAGRSGRGTDRKLSARDQMRVNAKAKTLGKEPEDLTDTEVNEALGVIKPGKPNAAMSKELRQSEDSKDEHYKQVDGEYRDLMQKAASPEEKKSIDEERIGKLQDVQNAWESELQRNNVDVDHFDVRTGKKASQYGEQKPQGAQAGKPSQKADFGPAPAGKKEGTTGMMGKTPVVVRNGRIVAQ